MLAGTQGLEGLRGVIGNGRVDVYGINFRILQQLIVIGVAFLDVELIRHGVHLRLIAAADGNEIGIRMGLMNGDKFRAEPEADDGNIESLVTHARGKSKKPAIESQSRNMLFPFDFP